MTSGALPLRTLVVLTVAVLALHLLLLRASPGAIAPGTARNMPTLLTRSVPAPAILIERAQEEKTSATRIRNTPNAIQSVAKPRVAAVGQVAGAAQEPQDLQPQRPVPATEQAAVSEPASESEAPASASPLREREAQASAFTIPGSMRVRYQVTARARGGEWNAQAELLWRHDGSSYDARLELSMPFLPSRVQRSTGRITAQGLAPTRFSDKARSEEAAHFERDKGRVVFSTNRPEAPLLAGAQDRLSVLLQLGAMLAGEPSRYPPSTTITVQTAGTRDADQWLFTVEQEEELQLPGGVVRAVKLTRNPRKEFDQKVELWLAPAMDYAPVRLRLTQANGDWLDQQWSATDRG